MRTESILLVRDTAGGDFEFEYAPGESNSSVWPGGIPVDGSAHREVETYPYLWLWVFSYIFNSVVILSALVCLVLTFIFRKKRQEVAERKCSLWEVASSGLGGLYLEGAVWLWTLP